MRPVQEQVLCDKTAERVCAEVLTQQKFEKGGQLFCLKTRYSS